MQRLLMVLVLSALLLSCGGGDENPSTPATAYTYPLTVAPTERHMVDQTAKSFLLVGDTAWSLFAVLSDQEADLYLENRKQHGFTAILANLIEHKFAANAPANFYGQTPFTGQLFTTPREEYFAHVDYIVKSSAEKGIAVFFFGIENTGRKNFVPLPVRRLEPIIAGNNVHLTIIIDISRCHTF